MPHRDKRLTKRQLAQFFIKPKSFTPYCDARKRPPVPRCKVYPDISPDDSDAHRSYTLRKSQEINDFVHQREIVLQAEPEEDYVLISPRSPINANKI